MIKFRARGVAMAIRIRLAQLLGQRKMTQAELSRKTEIRPNTINEMYWELTERVNLNHIEKICTVLDCEVSELIEIERVEIQ